MFTTLAAGLTQPNTHAMLVKCPCGKCHGTKPNSFTVGAQVAITKLRKKPKFECLPTSWRSVGGLLLNGPGPKSDYLDKE